MKGVHWSVWIALILLIVITVRMGRQCEMYAPPRDENTMPPYVENTGNVMEKDPNRPYVDKVTSNIQVDSQTQIYKDMAGLDFQIQAGNPILNFIQGNPLDSNIYGDFTPFESSSGNASMYYIVDSEQELMQLPETEKTEATCRKSLIVIDNTEYSVGSYSGIDLTGEIKVYPPVTITATGPNDARQVMSYSTDQTCPQPSRLVLDKDKTFDTIEVKIS